MSRPTDCRQHGAVLLVLAVIMSMVALGWLYGMAENRHAGDAATARALAVARIALIGRAVIDANRPGSLPCPDANNDGVADLPSGTQCPSYIGRLPWRTLGLSDIRDGGGERLWYALSRDAGYTPNLIINSQATAGLLQVNDNLHMVAVLFSPGTVIDPQQRGTPAQQLAVGNYLEGGNADGDNAYVAKTLADPAFDDRVMSVSSAELFRHVERLVLQQIAANLTSYAAQYHAYPFAGDQSGNAQPSQLAGYIPYNTLSFAPGNPLLANGWLQLILPLPSPPLPQVQPYVVTAGQDNVQINLEYCGGNMTLNKPMVVHCG